MSNFDTTTTLPNTGCTQEDIYNLLRTMVPVAGLVNAEGLQVLADKLHLALGVPRWVKYTKTFSQLAAAATVNEVELFQLPDGGLIHGIKLKASTAFTGGAISAYTAEIGITGNTDKYIVPFNILAAVSGTNYRLAWAPFFDDFAPAVFGSADAEISGSVTTANGAIGALAISNPPTQAEAFALRNATETLADDVRALATAAEELGDDGRALRATLAGLFVGNRIGGEAHNAATSIRITARSTGANLSSATAGSLDVWVLTSTVL